MLLHYFLLPKFAVRESYSPCICQNGSIAQHFIIIIILRLWSRRLQDLSVHFSLWQAWLSNLLVYCLGKRENPEGATMWKNALEAHTNFQFLPFLCWNCQILSNLNAFFIIFFGRGNGGGGKKIFLGDTNGAATEHFTQVTRNGEQPSILMLGCSMTANINHAQFNGTDLNK